MNKQTIIAVVIGLVIGGFTTLGVSAVVDKKDGPKGESQTSQTASTAGHNAEAAGKLKDLKGDEFDKAFIEEMIKHHQGAIDMAKLVESNAKHDELKKLGSEILTAQSKEIDMMQTWQSDWGYKNVPKSHSDTDLMGH